MYVISEHSMLYYYSELGVVIKFNKRLYIKQDKAESLMICLYTLLRKESLGEVGDGTEEEKRENVDASILPTPLNSKKDSRAFDLLSTIITDNHG